MKLTKHHWTHQEVHYAMWGILAVVVLIEAGCAWHFWSGRDAASAALVLATWSREVCKSRLERVISSL